MRTGYAIFLILAEAPQESPERLIERLRSEIVEEREAASTALKALGRAALPALEKAALDPDAEIASRASRLLELQRLREQISPATLALVPDAPERILSSGDPGCTELFLTLAREKRPSREDLALLAPRALAGARSTKNILQIVDSASGFRLHSAAPALVDLLSHPDGYLCGHVLQTLEYLEAVDQIPRIAQVARHPAAPARERAAKLLGLLAAREETPLLASLLKDADPDVRSSAGEALVLLDAKDRVADLLGLLEFPNSSVEGLVFLGQLGASEAIPAVRKRLREGGKAQRSAAAGALGALGARDAIPELLAALEDKETDVQGSAAGALGRLGHRPAFDPILKAFRAHPEALLSRAPRALIVLDDAQAGAVLPAFLVTKSSLVLDFVAGQMRTLIPLEPRPELLALLAHEEESVRKAAREVTSGVLPRGATSALIRLLGSKDEAIAAHAAGLLGVVGTEEAIPALRALLGDPREPLCLAAIGALRGFREPAIVPDLKPFLDHGKQSCRTAARWALFDLRTADLVQDQRRRLPQAGVQDRLEIASLLWQMEGAAAIPDLVKLLEDPVPDVRARALLALQSLGAESAGPAVARRLDDPEPQVRLMALWALGKIPVPQAGVPELRRLARAGEGQERSAAIRALARVADRESVPGWIERLSDVDEEIREVAAEAIARAAGPDHVRAVAALVGSKDSETRKGALRALRELRAPGAERALEDPLPSVRAAAVQAIAQLESPASTDLLVRALGDRDVGIRRRALHGLGSRWTSAVAAALRERLMDGDAGIQLDAAEVLCRHADRAGLALLLARGERLESLNALRFSSAWGRLRILRLEGEIEGTRGELLRRVATLAGLGVEMPEDLARAVWPGRFPKRPAPGTLLEVLDFVRDTPQRATWILEEDRIRVVTWGEALRFWRAWGETTSREK